MPAFAANLTNEGGVGGTFRLLRNVTGLWLLHECRRSLGARGTPTTRSTSSSRSPTDAPPLRAFVDPNDPVFAEPGDMPARVRAFCADTGQPEPADAWRGRALHPREPRAEARRAIEVLAAVTGTRADARLHVVGGGARNALLCRWTAEAAGLPVLAGPEEATLAREPARAGDGARRDRLARTRRARSSAPRSSPRYVRARAYRPNGRRRGSVSRGFRPARPRRLARERRRASRSAASPRPRIGGKTRVEGLCRPRRHSFYRSNLLGADRAIANMAAATRRRRRPSPITRAGSCACSG